MNFKPIKFLGSQAPKFPGSHFQAHMLATLYRYTCMTHSLLLYNYIVEYDSATLLPPILDILIPTVFDKC